MARLGVTPLGSWHAWRGLFGRRGGDREMGTKLTDGFDYSMITLLDKRTTLAPKKR